MTGRSDKKLSITSVTQVVKSHPFSLEELFKLALEEGCDFYIEIPDGISVYGTELPSGSIIDELVATHGLEASEGRPVKRGPTVRRKSLVPVNSEFEFLCLDPSECEPLNHRQFIKKNSFERIGLMRENGTVESFAIVRGEALYPNCGKEELLYFAPFKTFDSTEEMDYSTRWSSQPTKEKSVEICVDQLFIKTEDLDNIEQKRTSGKREFGKFEPQPWASAMLLDLNEVSTSHVSGKEKPDRKAITKTLSERWPHDHRGTQLLAQATFAILPDHLYRGSPTKIEIPPEIRSQYNDYASSALILINETAKRFWQEMENRPSGSCYGLRESIILELLEQGLTVRLAGAAATIIMPR